MFNLVYKHSFIKFFNYILVFLIVFYLSNYTTNEILSSYFYYSSLFYLSILFINYGYSHTSQDIIPKLHKNNFTNKLNIFLTTHFFIIILNSLILIFFFKIFLNKSDFLIIYLITLIVLSLNFFLIDTLRAIGKPYIGQIIQYNVVFLMNIILLLLLDRLIAINENTFLFIFLISFFIGFLILLNYSKTSLVFYNYISINFTEIRQYYKKFIYNGLNTVVFALVSYIFTILLYHFNKEIEVIHFNLALLFSSIVNLPLLFYNTNFARNLSIMVSNNEINLLKNLLLSITRKATIITLILIPIVIILQILFVQLFFNIAFNDYYIVFFLLCISLFINTIFGPNQIFLIVRHESKLLFIINLISIFLSIIFLLTQEINALNCSIAFLIYYSFMNIFLFTIIYLKFKIKIFFL